MRPFLIRRAARAVPGASDRQPALANAGLAGALLPVAAAANSSVHEGHELARSVAAVLGVSGVAIEQPALLSP